MADRSPQWEDSGRIDLDALMRQVNAAESGTRSLSADSPLDETSSTGVKPIVIPKPPASAPRLKVASAPPAPPALPPPAPPPAPPSISTASSASAPSAVVGPVPESPWSPATDSSSAIKSATATARARELTAAATATPTATAEPAPEPSPWAPSASAPASDASEKPRLQADENASKTRATKRHHAPIVAAAVVAAIAGLSTVSAIFLRPRPPVTAVANTSPNPNHAAPAQPAAIAAAAATTEANNETSPEALAPADDVGAAAAAQVGATTAAKRNSSPAAPSNANVPAAAASLGVADLALPSSPANPSDLGAAMQGAVGEAEKNAVMPVDEDRTNGARQTRPSPGAVVAALNAVLPTARACLGPDDAIRSGSVMFSSRGTVAKVDLRGAKASDECVRDALGKAHVEPFAEESFTTRVTVRPW